MSWRYAFGGEPEELGRTSRIEIDLVPIAGGVELTFTHTDLRNDTSELSHRSGWTGSLDKLVRLLGDSPELAGVNRKNGGGNGPSDTN
jgi:hypothetical protein